MKKLIIVIAILALISLIGTVVVAYIYRNEMKAMWQQYNNPVVKTHLAEVDEVIELNMAEKVLTLEIEDAQVEIIREATLAGKIKVQGQVKTDAQDYKMMESAGVISTRNWIEEWEEGADIDLEPSRPIVDKRRSKLKIVVPEDLGEWQINIKTYGGNEISGELVAGKIHLWPHYGSVNWKELKLVAEEIKIWNWESEWPQLQAQTLLVAQEDGEMKLENLNIEREIRVENDGGNLALINIASPLIEIANEGGDIRMENASASAVMVKNEHGRIVVKNVASVFTISNEDGDIEIRQSKFLENSKVVRDEGEGVMVMESEGELVKVLNK